MNEQRPRHRVSVKIALYNEARDRVLMTVVPGGGYGLPGGHVEGLEQPDEALRRELAEELGLSDDMYYDIAQRQFWREDNGDRIILGYTGILRDDAVITVDPEEVVDTVMASRDEIISGSISSSAYDTYLLEVLAR